MYNICCNNPHLCNECWWCGQIIITTHHDVNIKLTTLRSECLIDHQPNNKLFTDNNTVADSSALKYMSNSCFFQCYSAPRGNKEAQSKVTETLLVTYSSLMSWHRQTRTIRYITQIVLCYKCGWSALQTGKNRQSTVDNTATVHISWQISSKSRVWKNVPKKSTALFWEILKILYNTL